MTSAPVAAEVERRPALDEDVVSAERTATRGAIVC